MCVVEKWIGLAALYLWAWFLICVILGLVDQGDGGVNVGRGLSLQEAGSGRLRGDTLDLWWRGWGVGWGREGNWGQMQLGPDC